MASEPTDEPLSVSLPPELVEWVDERAADHGTDRETALVQLLAAHRAAGDLQDGDGFDTESFADAVDLDEVVRPIVRETIEDVSIDVSDETVQAVTETAVEEATDRAVAEATERAAAEAADQTVDESVEEALEDAVDQISDRVLEEATEAVTEQVTQDVDEKLRSMEEQFVEKLQDVRERVIQVKKETDQKAPIDHEHPELVDRLDGLASSVVEFESDLAGLEEDLSESLAGQDERLEDVEDSLEDARGKLRTIAHVIKDLRDKTKGGSKRATSVEQIKQAAARKDIDRAVCEICGEAVDIALLTDPECPHCEATVTDVEPKDGFFGKPKLRQARSLESGDGDTDE